jgi:tRNA dimethylallyltransferase
VPEDIRIPIICGPTGSGKTSVALELAERIPIEIVSADSRQLVKRLNIGTAKPTAEEQARVAYHLIDMIEPGERYSAFRFIDDANTVIDGILKRGPLPVVVGGTGLYLRALTDGVVEMDADDMGTRERLEREMAEYGAQAMYDRLKEIDPIEASRIHPHNKVRVIRALEIFSVTGKSKSELSATGRHRRSPYRFTYFCLVPPRPSLYSAIDARVESMMAEGLIDEITALVGEGLKIAIRKSNIIGYNEILDYLEGRQSLSEAVALIKQNSRRYAKRQMTWFRHQVDCTCIEEKAQLLDALLGALN